MVACQQFRARDCTDCTFFLFSATQPVIESSLGLRFACYTLDYFRCGGWASMPRGARVCHIDKVELTTSSGSRCIDAKRQTSFVLSVSVSLCLPVSLSLCLYFSLPPSLSDPQPFLSTTFLFSSPPPHVARSTTIIASHHQSLAGQFAAAKLSVWNNKWSQVYNFTGGGEGDWSCLPYGAHHR